LKKVENPYVAYYSSPIGTLEIKCSGDTVIAIEFIEEITDYPPLPENQTLEICISQLREYFEGTRRIFDLQIDQDGTSFQQSTWHQVRDIPFGNTITYRELAIKTGNPKNIRSVGTANGKNKIAIVVPCHRVIGNKGELTGFAWGLWRKQWLLEHEGRLANGIQTLF
jgi:methylated-DNA-[protein]-cysteine S-methyltransferase